MRPDDNDLQTGSHAANDPLLVDIPASDVNHARVVRGNASVVQLKRLNHDTFELIVECATNGPRLHGKAGQFATLKPRGMSRARPYSFARDPGSELPGQHTFLMRQVAGGEMSAWLERDDCLGAEVEIAGPLGSFVLDDSDQAMLLVAGGSGISAIYALAESAARRQVARDCTVIFGAREQRDLNLRERMMALGERWHPEFRFRYIEILSDAENDTDWRGKRGFVTEAIAELPALLAHRVWLCGPPPMIDAARSLLTDSGVQPEQIICDVFEDASSPAPVINNRRCVLCDECLLVRPVENCIIETGLNRTTADGHLGSYERLRPAETAGLYYNALVIDPERCIRCYACVGACPHGAIAPEPPPFHTTLVRARE